MTKFAAFCTDNMEKHNLNLYETAVKLLYKPLDRYYSTFDIFS